MSGKPITHENIGETVFYYDPKNQGKRTGVLVSLTAEIAQPIKGKRKKVLPASECELYTKEENQ
jgi:hypothetical protein